MSKKIIFVANAAFTITNFRNELIKSLKDKNYEVIVACPPFCPLSGNINASESLKKIGVVHYPIHLSRSGTNPISEIKLFISLANLFKTEQPDIVLNYTIKPTIYGSLAAKIFSNAKIYSTITGIGYLFTSRSFKSKLLGLIIKSQYYVALKTNNIVFFQNNDDLTLFKKKGFLNNVKTKIINGSGVNLDEFKTLKSSKETNSFIMIARILKDKGVLEYIEAARSVKKNFPNTKFTLLGPLDDNPESFSLTDIESWQNEGVIDYVSAQKNVRPFLAKSQVFVLPSYREGTPRSVLEAMAMEMPIITTNAPGCKETVVDGKNGFLVEVKNTVQLANAMEKFILEKDLVSKMGAVSLKIAQEKYDVNIVNQSILAEIIS
jgi:glycosyltransferase involved in cell wall biosynthesis